MINLVKFDLPKGSHGRNPRQGLIGSSVGLGASYSDQNGRLEWLTRRDENDSSSCDTNRRILEDYDTYRHREPEGLTWGTEAEIRTGGTGWWRRSGTLRKIVAGGKALR